MIKLVLGEISPRGAILHLAYIITNYIKIYRTCSRFGARTAVTAYTVHEIELHQ